MPDTPMDHAVALLSTHRQPTSSAVPRSPATCSALLHLPPLAVLGAGSAPHSLGAHTDALPRCHPFGAGGLLHVQLCGWRGGWHTERRMAGRVAPHACSRATLHLRVHRQGSKQSCLVLCPAALRLHLCSGLLPHPGGCCISLSCARAWPAWPAGRAADVWLQGRDAVHCRPGEHD